MQQKEKKPMKKWKKRLLISVATIAVIAIGLGLFINNWMAVENSKVPLPTFNWQAKKIDNAQLNQFTKDNSVFIPLNQQVDSITTAELKGLDTWVGNAKYIGLGEVTHGSVENFVLKTKLVQYLVDILQQALGIQDSYSLILAFFRCVTKNTLTYSII
jgi:hypothetical protein